METESSFLRQLEKIVVKEGGYDKLQKVEKKNKWSKIAEELAYENEEKLKSIYKKQILSKGSKDKDPIPIEEEEEETGEQLFAVESIVDEQVMNGQVFYHVKWVDWPDSANTWEPKTKLIEDDCQEIIEEWELKKRKKSDSNKSQKKSLDDTPRRGRPPKNANKTTKSKASKEKEEDKLPELADNQKLQVGFDYGHTLDAIWGAVRIRDTLYYYCTWKDKSGKQLTTATMQPNYVIHEKCPEKLIAWFESRIVFHDKDDTKSK